MHARDLVRARNIVKAIAALRWNDDVHKCGWRENRHGVHRSRYNGVSGESAITSDLVDSVNDVLDVSSFQVNNAFTRLGAVAFDTMACNTRFVRSVRIS